jgi:type VI secretion system secreted protein VgrG
MLELRAGGQVFEVDFVHGAMALSEPFSFGVRAMVRESGPSPDDLLGQTATLTLRDPFDQALTVNGLVAAVERTIEHTGAAHYDLVVAPEMHVLTLGRNSRVFQEQSAVDIVKKVLADAGLTGGTRWSIRGSYAVRPYCTQYRETDWSFITRLMAEEGLYSWFELTADAATLVFADTSADATPIEGGGSLAFHEGAELGAVSAATRDVRCRDVVTTDKVRLRDYSFEKPRLVLDATAGDGPREKYVYRGRFRVPADGDRLAKVHMEALRARRTVVTGETSSSLVRPGLQFEMTAHPVESLNRPYLVTEVACTGTDAREGGAKQTVFRWTAIPLDVPFRRAMREVTRGPGGVQTGIVAGAPGEEIHPDKIGRVRVQLYWDREGQKDDKASTWMRVGQFALGGSMILPRIGWDTVIGFEEGDADVPVVLGHLYDGQLRPPYALPGNKTRTAWQTATTPGGGSTNEIRFEDKAGSEEIFLHASKDTNVKIGDNKTETVGVDHTEQIGSNLDVKIGSNLTLGVGADQSVSVGGSETLTVSGGRGITVGADESVTIGGSRSVTASGGSSLDATGGRSRTVGGTQTALSALGVTRTVLGSFSQTVGGAWITAAAAGLGNMTGGAAAETVGGAKIEAGAKGVTLSVKGAAAETVGGAYVIAAGGNAGETATSALAITVGGAFIGNAPEIVVEAETEISIRAGGATLTVKPSSVELKAPLVGGPAAKIVKKAVKITHN